MRNTVVLEVKGKQLSFWPIEENMGNTSVHLKWWPKALTQRMQKPGIYAIKRLSGTTKGITGKIQGRELGDFHPAKWAEYYGCSICQRLLTHWGITISEDVTRTYYFKVTKL